MKYHTSTSLAFLLSLNFDTILSLPSHHSSQETDAQQPRLKTRAAEYVADPALIVVSDDGPQSLTPRSADQDLRRASSRSFLDRRDVESGNATRLHYEHVKRAPDSGGTRIELDQDPSGTHYVAKTSVRAKGGRLASTWFTRFDTINAEYMVPGRRCTPARGCRGPDSMPRYDDSGEPFRPPSDSPNDITIDMALDDPDAFTDFYNGLFYKDDVEVYGIVVKDMPVFSVSSAETNELYDGEFQAVMGLAPPHRDAAARPDRQSFFQRMIDDNLFSDSAPEISMFHGRRSSGTLDLSEFNFGGRNPTLYTGQLFTMELTARASANQLWEVPVFGALVADHILPGDNIATAIIDTASDFVIAPTSITDQLFSRIQGFEVEISDNGFTAPREEHTATRFPPQNTYYAYPCGAEPQFSVVLGDLEYEFDINALDFRYSEIRAEDKNFDDPVGKSALKDARAKGTKMCLSAVVGRRSFKAGEPLWGLGTPFLRNWYTILIWGPDTANGSGKRIAMAKAIDKPGGGGAGGGRSDMQRIETA